MIELTRSILLYYRKASALEGLYKKIVMFEWFAVVALSSWFLIIFSAILN